MVCQLTGMEVANAGMYDGATSMAEAVLMAARLTRRDRVAVLDTVSPYYRDVLATYVQAPGLRIDTVPPGDETLAEDTACLVVQQPGFLGYLGGPRGPLPQGPRQRRAADRRRGPDIPGDVQAPRRLRRRHRRGRGTGPGHRADLRRAVRRHIRLQAALRAPDARPNRRPDRRLPRPHRVTCSRSRQGSSTSDARRPRPTYAPRSGSSRSCPRSTWPPRASAGCGTWPSSATTRPTTPRR